MNIQNIIVLDKIRIEEWNKIDYQYRNKVMIELERLNVELSRNDVAYEIIDTFYE